VTSKEQDARQHSSGVLALSSRKKWDTKPQPFLRLGKSGDVSLGLRIAASKNTVASNLVATLPRFRKREKGYAPKDIHAELPDGDCCDIAHRPPGLGGVVF
jgi:hypothetical protein